MFARFQELRAGDGVPEHWRYFRHERAQVDEAREVAVYHLRHRRRRTGRRRKHDKAQRHNYPTPATLAFAVGDVVRFTGNTHYTNAAAASGAACKPGTAKVTALAKGAKHPYHLIKQPGGGSTVYGWVNAADVQAVGSGTTAPKMRVGAKVKYSGPLYRDSNGGGQGKTVNGTYTVKYYYPARKCGVHIDGLGWVPESGCTVIG